MAIFDDLNNEYAAWRKRFSEDHHAAVKFAHVFCSGFQSYIEAPVSYKSLIVEGEVRPYVSAKKLIDTGDDVYELVDPETYLGLLVKDDDGFWAFGLSVVFETDRNTFPKQPLGLGIYFVIVDGICRMLVTKRPGSELQFPISDPSSYHDVYDKIVAVFHEYFSSKPSDELKERNRIGFISKLPPIEGK